MDIFNVIFKKYKYETGQSNTDLSEDEKRQFFSFIKGAHENFDGSYYSFDIKLPVSAVATKTWSFRVEKELLEQYTNNYSAVQTTEDTISQTAEEQKLVVAHKDLIAMRLDEGDACNIIDPYKMTISPCGCHYSKNDIAYMVQQGLCKNEGEALSYLASHEKYVSLSADVQKKIDDGTIDLSFNSLLERYHLTADNLTINVTKDGEEQAVYTNPTQEQMEAAQRQNTVFGDRETAYSTNPKAVDPNAKDVTDDTTTPNMPTSQGTTVFAEVEFVQWLCEWMNELFRADPKTPMIPTSIGVSIALVRGTNSSANFKKFNFWRFPYNEGLTSIPQESEECTFYSAKEGMEAILAALHSKEYAGAVSSLKAKMWDSTEEDKVTAMRSILIILAGNNATEQFNEAMAFVKKYNLREWDTNVTEENGGHADTKANSSVQAQKVESRMSRAVKHLTEVLADKGLGVLVIPIGPKYSKIIKLPIGKTFCEPIYPDYLTVGDQIPEWVMSESYAIAAKQAEEAALKAAGIASQSQEEIDLEYVNNQISAFQEQQFAAWCQENGITYTDEASKAAAIQTYREAAAADPEHFTDGIWTPDSATKAAYTSLLRDKANIQYNGDVATAAAHLQYVEAAQKVADDIQAREGSWNQSSGSAISSADMGLTGGTDFSAVDNSPNYTGTPGQGQAGVKYTTVSAAGFKLMNGGGYGTYWVGQTGATSWSGAQSKTLNAMDVLGQWFYKKTGCPLVITAVTNGSHAGGEHSHGNGWKFDCNDFGSGAEGTLTSESYGKGTLTNEFLAFGTSIGLGMNWEAPGTNNVHIDVSAWGDQWADTDGNSLSSVINHGGLRE